jgi:DNA modification methylase
MINRIFHNDCLIGLQALPPGSVHCCVTSPPYYGLRDYGTSEQIGLEETPELFIEKLVAVFREVKRLLKDDGTLWVNMGDSYCANATGSQGNNLSTLQGGKSTQIEAGKRPSKKGEGLKPKDLIGIPWMLAFALRADGWYLRQDIIWAKKNCMPESVTDRCTKSHEYIFLLSKSSKYYFDSTAIQEDAVWDVDGNGTLKRKLRQKVDNKSNPEGQKSGIRKVYEDVKTGDAFKSVNGKRNKRSVWNYPTAQYPDAHFATFPEDLIVDCIKAGCPEGGIVLDPFMGAGTTALVARKLDRNYVGFELNQEYINIAKKRLKSELGLFL